MDADLANLFPPPEQHVPRNALTKKTFLRSPIITGIFPDFKVCLLKPVAGLPSTSLNDENDQTLHAPEQDSYFGDEMSEDEGDDILWNLESKPFSQKSPQNAEYTHATLLVKTSSISVNGVEFALNSGIRASTIIPGSEDSLYLSLNSGFLLLIRIWHVPRTFTDSSYAQESPLEVPKMATSHVYKPFVVQWWKSAAGAVETSGNLVSAHNSGLAVVATSTSSVFRIHMAQHTEAGMQLLPHHNVPVNGIILHSCFARPLDRQTGDDHVAFLALTFSHQRRLELSLYRWYVSESLANNLEKNTLPLNNSFPVPVMVVPLAHDQSFLFVCVHEFVIVTVHNITSADYSFSRFAYTGSFPTAFYLPESPILSFEDGITDEVLLASDSGIIYSVVITGNTKLTAQPIVRVADPISVFTFKAGQSGYLLNYASDTGGARELVLRNLFSREYLSTLGSEKPGYTEATLVCDHKNWAPVIDVLVIDSYRSRNFASSSSQELWALTGVGKRTRLSQLSSGYLAKKDSTIFEPLRKTEGLFSVDVSGSTFLICSMPFETKMLEYQDDQEDEVLVEIESPQLFVEDSTLNISKIEGCECLIQITPASITFSDLESVRTSHLEDKSVLFAEIWGKNCALVMQTESGVSIELVGLSAFNFESDVSPVDSSSFQSLCSAPISFEISMFRVFVIDTEGRIVLVAGSFDEKLFLFGYDPAINTIQELSHISLDALNPYPTKSILRLESVVPHDAAYTNSTLFVGSKAGHFIQFTASAGFELELARFLRLGTSPVRFSQARNDSKLLFVHLRNLWLFNFYDSKLPLRVIFDEKVERSVARMIELPTEEEHEVRFAFVRDDGVTIASIFCHKAPIVKQVNIGEAAKKMNFLDSVNLFSLLCKSKEAAFRLKFVDRKSFRILPSVEVDSRLGSQRKDSIFGPNEVPLCGFVWEIKRQDRISKKLIVGSLVDDQSGSIKILDICKFSLTESVGVKVMELISILRDEPITCIQQIESTIFFSSGRKIFSTSYSLEKKKLRPVQTLATLSSQVVSMSVSGTNTLLVNTKMDSLIAFMYTKSDEEDYDEVMETGEENPSRNNSKENLTVVFKDPISRSLVNHAKLDSKLIAGDKLHSSLIIVDPEDVSLKNQFTYRMSVIPRIFISGFNGVWATEDDEARDHILSVGVNGEVVVFDSIFDGANEISQLRTELASQNKLRETDSLEAYVQRLDRPFMDKVTGKGFQNIYKPFFDYTENQGKIIDYDLDDLSVANSSSIII